MAQIRKLQVLIVTFVIMLLMTRFYLHISPEWDPFQTTLGVDGDASIEFVSPDNGSIPDDDKIIEKPSPKDPEDIPFTILTGASRNHFCPLKSFLYSTSELIKGFSNARIIVYDLGLSVTQREILDTLLTKGYFTELRAFNWEKYPSFWNIKSGAKGEYAWKPGMVYEISNDYPGIIIWLDSGTKVRKTFFNNMTKLLDKYNGFVSPKSPGTMKSWTHPGVYEYFKDNHKKYDKLSNCNGASIAFDTNRSRSLIDAWYKCALDKNCIAPPGSSRKNHRQDQALLTYLAAREGRFCDRDRTSLGFHVHDDGNCKKENDKYESEYNIVY